MNRFIGVSVLILSGALPFGASGGEDPRLEQVVTLEGGTGQGEIPLPDAMRQLSQQTGLTLVIADSPKVRQATVKAGTKPFRAVLEEVASGTETELKVEESVVVWIAHPDDDFRPLWRYLEGERGSFEKPFAGLREVLWILKLLSPEQRWQLWGEGKVLTLAELSVPQREKLMEILRASRRKDVVEIAAALTPEATLSGHWELNVELRSRLGYYATSLREADGGKPPPAQAVEALLEEMIGICDRVLQGKGSLAALQAEQRCGKGGRLVLLPAAENGLYTLGQMAAAIREQGGIECYVDARMEDRTLFVSGPGKGVEVGALRVALAQAVGSLWRVVGEVEILIPDPYREVDRRLETFWEESYRLEREFDEQFIKLARLWMGEVLRPLSDAQLRAGAFPYKMVVTEMAGWRLDVQQMRNTEGETNIAALLEHLQRGEPTAVSVRPVVSLRFECPEGKTLWIGVNPLGYDFQERNRLFGRQ